jgi:hypothetical protein
VRKKTASPAGKKLQAKNCFVCGRDNSRGLGVPFFYNNDTVTATFVPGDWLSGFEKVVHGGVIFCLADEAMMYLIWASELKAISAEVSIRFHNYAHTANSSKSKRNSRSDRGD